MGINHKSPFILLFFAMISLCFASTAYPASESVFASYKYTMGDNDTKNDAKRICFLEAKRLAIEKAGTYIESSTEVKNFQLTRDEIRTFAGAIVKVDIASEEIKFIGENQVILMTVKADVDIDSFRERVKQIKSDRELEKKVIDQQRQLQGMEDKLKNLQQQLTTKNLDDVIKIRKERTEAFEKMDELEKIKYAIKSKSKSAANIELGMTPQEVLTLIGTPRTQTKNIYPGDLRFNYGNVWIVFESGVVSCMVWGDIFQNDATCSHYRAFYKDRVIK
ncbi:MAG: hypothetical protein D4R93_00895 [Deltaproteobacteria bacterium]|nr:MAG: hypothetical protein D4R93_00895 [Deltaproteobacteria bacterium]